jgi:hypothetical protein
MLQGISFQAFHGTVSAICDTIAASRRPAAESPIAGPYEDVSQFVLSCLSEMPRPFAFGIQVLTVCFALGGVLYAGRFFPQNSGAARQRQWARWRTHRLSVLRDFVRFYESVATLALFSRPGLPAWRA